jgi:hypothetical protein
MYTQIYNYKTGELEFKDKLSVCLITKEYLLKRVKTEYGVKFLKLIKNMVVE